MFSARKTKYTLQKPSWVKTRKLFTKSLGGKKTMMDALDEIN